ncbi:MAG: RNA-binding S4 domain-containing protein [Flavobacteriales bacterium]|nr:RNA-binding S4 domain-containing protein [Flavobacteriales bacterium]
MRIDKFLWHVRIFKTRSLATKHCEKGKVKLNGSICKPSRNLSTGDAIEVHFPPIWKTFEVIDFPKNRVGAKLVSQYLNNTTPEEVLEEYRIYLKQSRENFQFWQGGRPTKKNRRDLDELMDWE